MVHKKEIATVLIVFFMLAAAVLPFFGRGFLPTHDGEYHLIRFMEFDRMIWAGQIFPRWAPTLNSGFGLPLFEFMYPLPNYIASFFHLTGTDFVTVFKWESGLGYLAAAVFCFLWLRRKFGLIPASVGTVAAFYVPYWFVELYVRGSIGEVWAIVFLFALFYFIETGGSVGFIISASLLILSHNILAMLFFPVAAAYALYKQSWKWLTYMILGAVITSWFWMPAVVESRYMTGLNTVDFRDHFAGLVDLLIPSWGTEFSGSNGSGSMMSFQIGIMPLIWLIFGSIFIVKNRRAAQSREAITVIILFLASIFMTLPVSLPIWNVVRFLQFTQYPWRLLVFVIPVTAYMASYASGKLRKKWIGIFLSLASVVIAFSYTRGAVYRPRNDFYYQSRQNFTEGTSSMGNSLSTIWTPWKQNPAASLVTDLRGNPLPVNILHSEYLDKLFIIDSAGSEKIRINVLYFPGWTVLVNNIPTSINFSSNGTLDVTIPAGNHRIEAIYTETPIRTAADIISILSLVGLIIWGILRMYEHRN